MDREAIGNEPQCLATIEVFDDRWGSFTDRCRLVEGHAGDHRSPRTACVPEGYLGWPQDDQHDGDGDVG